MRRRRARVTTRFVRREWLLGVLGVLGVLEVLGVLILPLRVGAYVAVIAAGRTVGMTRFPMMREMGLDRMMGRVIGIKG